MAAGDVEVYGPFKFQDIDAGLTGHSITTSDLVIPVRQGSLYGFVVIKAA